MSESLGLSAHRLEEMMGEMQQTILVNHYPPCPRPDLAIGIDTHTDVGAVSCLWQPDDVVGLQVLREGEWHPVSSARGALTIIVADQVQIASNGIFKSPLHRGVLNKDKNRVSILSFYQLNPEQLVSPLEDLISDSSPPMYQPTRFKDHEQAAKGPLSANAS
ncbi:hypothetical protein KP509_30G022500 [Ceratopteris richardii]|nr:hypothetical protein KP509_30G022500 [Ceratopteris richardii]